MPHLSALPPPPQVVNSTWALKHLQPLPLEDARRGSYESRMPLGGTQVRPWLRSGCSECYGGHAVAEH